MADPLQTTGFRGPNIQGWLCLGFFGWVSYANWSLWPIGLFLAVSIIPSGVMIMLDRKRSAESV